MKLYDINVEFVEDRGFFEVLKDMIFDSNFMVVVNVVVVFVEI